MKPGENNNFAFCTLKCHKERLKSKNKFITHKYRRSSRTHSFGNTAAR